MSSVPIHRSKSGWWQALCGNYICHKFWTNLNKDVTCKDCKRRIAKGEHLHRTRADVLAFATAANDTQGNHPKGSGAKGGARE